MLFLIYINDIEKSTSLKILSYANDTTVYQSGPNVDYLIINSNHELKLLYDWLGANKLPINVKKTNWCIFSPQNSNYEVNLDITINNKIISQMGIRDNEETVKFLGIHIIYPHHHHHHHQVPSSLRRLAVTILHGSRS